MNAKEVRKARKLAADTIESLNRLDDTEKEKALNKIVHLLATAEAKDENEITPIEEWEQHNEDFSYEPPNTSPENWDSEQYQELFDRAIRQEVNWVCTVCNTPHRTLRKARSHVRSKHQEKLIEKAKNSIDEDQDQDDDEDDNGKTIEERRKNNAQLSQYERE